MKVISPGEEEGGASSCSNRFERRRKYVTEVGFTRRYDHYLLSVMSTHSTTAAFVARHARNLRRFASREERRITPVGARDSADSPSTENALGANNYVRYRGVTIMKDEAIAFSLAFSKMKAAVKLVNEMSKMIPHWQLVLGFSVDGMEDVRKLRDSLIDVKAEIIAADPDPAQSNSFFDFFERFQRIARWLLGASLTSPQGENEISSFTKREEFESIWTNLMMSLKVITTYRVYYASDQEQLEGVDSRTRTEQMTAVDTLLHDMIRENASTLSTTCTNLSGASGYAINQLYAAMMRLSRTLHYAYTTESAESYTGPVLDDSTPLATTMRHVAMMVTTGHQMMTPLLLKSPPQAAQTYLVLHQMHMNAATNMLSTISLPSEGVEDADEVVSSLISGMDALVRSGVVPEDDTSAQQRPSSLQEATRAYVSMIRLVENAIIYPLSQENHALHALITKEFSLVVSQDIFMRSLNFSVMNTTHSVEAFKFGLSMLADAPVSDMALDTKEVGLAMEYWSHGMSLDGHILQGSTFREALTKHDLAIAEQSTTGRLTPTSESILTDILRVLRKAVAETPSTALTSDLSEQINRGYQLDVSARKEDAAFALEASQNILRERDTPNEVRAHDDLVDAVLRGKSATDLRRQAGSLGRATVFARMVEMLRRFDEMETRRTKERETHLRLLSNLTRTFLRGVLEDMRNERNASMAMKTLEEIDASVGETPATASDAIRVAKAGEKLLERLQNSQRKAKSGQAKTVFMLLHALTMIGMAISDHAFVVEVEVKPESFTLGSLAHYTRTKEGSFYAKLNRSTQGVIHQIMTLILLAIGIFVAVSLYSEMSYRANIPANGMQMANQTLQNAIVDENTNLQLSGIAQFQNENLAPEIMLMQENNVTRISELPQSARNDLIEELTNSFAKPVFQAILDGGTCGNNPAGFVASAQGRSGKPSMLGSDKAAFNTAWGTLTNLPASESESTSSLIPVLDERSIFFKGRGNIVDYSALNYEPGLRSLTETALSPYYTAPQSTFNGASFALEDYADLRAVKNTIVHRLYNFDRYLADAYGSQTFLGRPEPELVPLERCLPVAIYKDMDTNVSSPLYKDPTQRRALGYRAERITGGNIYISPEEQAALSRAGSQGDLNISGRMNLLESSTGLETLLAAAVLPITIFAIPDTPETALIPFEKGADDLRLQEIEALETRQDPIATSYRNRLIGYATLTGTSAGLVAYTVQLAIQANNNPSGIIEAVGVERLFVHGALALLFSGYVLVEKIDRRVRG